jgi:putative colanic acid biosynthesis glycosyltransferase
MIKVCQVNTTVNSGSHGRIAEQIGCLVLDSGGKSFFAFGRDTNFSRSIKFKINNVLDFYIHAIISRLFDRHGLGSKLATKRLCNFITSVNPDIIHLHNIHGYYLNYIVLFEFLREFKKPVVWTLHDCWPFTGHCAFFEKVGCEKWKSQCFECPQIDSYPKSFGWDNSSNNFFLKKEYFTSITNLTIVPVSFWLSNVLKYSFLKNVKSVVIYNGIDLSCFRVLDNIDHFIGFKFSLSLDSKIILGVANVWEERKGLADFIQLSMYLPSKFKIILVGLNKDQISNLPANIFGIERTDNTLELVKIYNSSYVFFNPTYEDNFPTTNLEALACGVPVITYNTGGSPEAIDDSTGYVVEKGAINEVLKIILESKKLKSNSIRLECRERAEKYFDKNVNFSEYLNLYNELYKYS